MAFKPVWANKIEIGTSATTADPPVWTYSQLCKGIKGMQININENVVTEQYLCGEGHAHNEVTGMAPQVQITGLQFKLGSERVSSVRITTSGKIITCDCVISDIVAFGGNSAELKPFNCNLRFNGTPTVTTAA